MMVNFLKKSVINIDSWKTSRKLLVIESDDWGAIRMPDKQTYDEALKRGIPVNRSIYCRYDSLATHDDLEALYGVLLKHEDKNQRNPVITANSVMCNPDFDKIREGNFEKYYYEHFTQTLANSVMHEKSFDLWIEGINEKIFVPQLHGREHLNVLFWLRLLRENVQVFRKAFDLKFWGMSRDCVPEFKRSVQASFDLESRDELPFARRSISEACELFQDHFGYKSKSFVAPNYIWDELIENDLRENGVEVLQGMKYQKQPLYDSDKRIYKRRRWGGGGLFNTIRNCSFEPSLSKDKMKCLHFCFKSIENAFLWKKPAIISSHRLNFIGSLREENRRENLQLLDLLLSTVLHRWPNVEFVTSAEVINTEFSINSIT